MISRRVLKGLTTVFATCLAIIICLSVCAFDNAGPINGFLKISTSKVTGGGFTTYYPSEYGDLFNGSEEEYASLSESKKQELRDSLTALRNDTYLQVEKEMEEGAVLLLNNNSALPLNQSEKRVTLFGNASEQPLFKPVSADSDIYDSKTFANLRIDLKEALEEENFTVNPVLHNAYANSSTPSRKAGVWAEEPISFYTQTIRNSFADYNDVAIVVFAREGGEGIDLKTNDSFGMSELAFHDDEKALMQMVSANFNKVIVLLNSPYAMEVEWLNDYNVDACLWIGSVGVTGFRGVVDLLTGQESPSGKLVDTYATNSLSSPAVQNANGNTTRWSNSDDTSIFSNQGPVTDSVANTTWVTVQVENIYVGYKYYETRYEDAVLNQGNASGTAGAFVNSTWDYASEVSYPFGFGLSFSSFEQTLEDVVVGQHEITVTVKVKNTGSVAGKSVVQVYAQTPYGLYERENKVEKSAIQLVGFAKTKKLEQNEEETLEIRIDTYLLASYDHNNAKGYVMSQGDYYLAIGNDSHDALNNVLCKKGATNLCDHEGNAVLGNESKVFSWNVANIDTQTHKNSSANVRVTNLFDYADANYWYSEPVVEYLTRADWQGTFPQRATVLTCVEEMYSWLQGDFYEKSETAKSLTDFEVDYRANITDYIESLPTLPFYMMKDVDYDDNETWNRYLDQMGLLDQLATTLDDFYGTSLISAVEIPSIHSGDGCDSVGGTYCYFSPFYCEQGEQIPTCGYNSKAILTATFNVELIESRGKLTAEEALHVPVAVVWGNGGNLHRTPFSGRNFEYYSEDANLNYLASIVECEAMQAKGVLPGIKHFAGNDQEDHREGLNTFFLEQAFREGALRGFEGALRVAKSRATMQSFNRIGVIWASACKELCTDVLREEWGFEGYQITDAVQGVAYKMHFSTTLMAGTDVYCFTSRGVASSPIVNEILNNDDGDLLEALRFASKNYHYAMSHSCAVNGIGADSQIIEITPWWQILLYCLIGVTALAFLASLALFVVSRLKAKHQKQHVLADKVKFILSLANVILTAIAMIIYVIFTSSSDTFVALVLVFGILAIISKILSTFVDEPLLEPLTTVFWGLTFGIFTFVNALPVSIGFFTGVHDMFGNIADFPNVVAVLALLFISQVLEIFTSFRAKKETN